jgi:hypothetical protein
MNEKEVVTVKDNKKIGTGFKNEGDKDIEYNDENGNKNKVQVKYKIEDAYDRFNELINTFKKYYEKSEKDVDLVNQLEKIFNDRYSNKGGDGYNKFKEGINNLMEKYKKSKKDIDLLIKLWNLFKKKWVRIIDFDYLPEYSISFLANIIKMNSIKILRVSLRYEITNEALIELLKQLQNCESLLDITINNASFKYDTLDQLLKICSYNKNLAILNLSYNGLNTTDCVKRIVKYVNKATFLRELHLEGNGLREKVSKLCITSNIIHLNLSNNSINDCYIGYVCSIIEKNKDSLIELDLSMNRIKTKEATELLNFMKDKANSIVNLNLKNNLIDGSDDFCRSFLDSKKLCWIDLSYNLLGYTQIKIIMANLKYNYSLFGINLFQNRQLSPVTIREMKDYAIDSNFLKCVILNNKLLMKDDVRGWDEQDYQNYTLYDIVDMCLSEMIKQNNMVTFKKVIKKTPGVLFYFKKFFHEIISDDSKTPFLLSSLDVMDERRLRCLKESLESPFNKQRVSDNDEIFYDTDKLARENRQQWFLRFSKKYDKSEMKKEIKNKSGKKKKKSFFGLVSNTLKNLKGKKIKIKYGDSTISTI